MMCFPVVYGYFGFIDQNDIFEEKSKMCNSTHEIYEIVHFSKGFGVEIFVIECFVLFFSQLADHLHSVTFRNYSFYLTI